MNINGKDIKINGRLVRIARLEAEKYAFVEDPEPLMGALRHAGRRIDLFTFMQRLPETAPKHGYPMEWDNLAAIPVTTFDFWWNKQIDNKTRNMVRRAEKKGVEVREAPFGDSLVRGIWEIYNESPVRQGKAFRHYGKDLATVHNEEATFLDRSVFVGAYSGGKLIGFVKLTMDETATQAGLMNILSMISERERSPTNALIAQAVRSCAERNIPYLVYANLTYGNKKKDGLSDFKRNNGFQRFEVPRYYVPLSPIGRAAYYMGLHKPFNERIPESVLAKLRRLRQAWYGSTFSGSRLRSSSMGAVSPRWSVAPPADCRDPKSE
jgi:hypothetical protein